MSQGSIKPSGSAYYSGSMIDVFGKLERDNFQMLVIEKKADGTLQEENVAPVSFVPMTGEALQKSQ